MFRILSITITLAALMSMSGCVMGPCGGGGHCDSCDGQVQGHIHATPVDSFRAWRRSLTCNSGCGETYWDEWYSTPPDCVDPCPQFACDGGAVCGGDCGGCGGCGCDLVGHGGYGVRPLQALGGLFAGIYGKRFCGDCGYAYDDCCCDGGYVGGEFIDGGEIIGDGFIDGGTVIEGPAIQGGGGGCANGNCSIGNRGTSPMAKRVRRSPAYEQAMARQQAAADMRSAQASNSTPDRVVYPNETESQFYRQATRLPQRQPLRR